MAKKITIIRRKPAEYACWVANIIESKPKEYDQSWWYSFDYESPPAGNTVRDFHCSSSCCIGGWLAACYAQDNGELIDQNTPPEKLAKLALGIDEGVIDHPLFQQDICSSWPERYVRLYDKNRARAAARSTASFLRLQELYNSCERLYIRDWDGWDMQKHGMSSLTQVINNPRRKMGHGFFLKAMLENDPVLDLLVI